MSVLVPFVMNLARYVSQIASSTHRVTLALKIQCLFEHTTLQPWVLPSVEQAISRLASRVRKDGLEYTPISGTLARFGLCTVRLGQ